VKMIKSIPALPVKDINAATKFYETRLGFFARHVEQDFAIVQRDDLELHLWAACNESWRIPLWITVGHPVKTGAESFLAGTASCRIQVEEIDALYSEYKASGVLYGPNAIVTLQPWGHRDFPVLDLERNLITFYQT